MSTEQNNQDKPLVLLATQSHLSAKSIKKLLQPQFDVVEAEDAEAIWNLLIAEPSAYLLLSDLSTANNSFGLLERIKSAQNKNISNLPVLLLFHEADEDADREAALIKGATDFLTLPFSSVELVARVRMHTGVFAKIQQPPIDLEQDESADFLQQIAQENYFESRLQQELSFSSRHKIPVSACHLELNGLSRIEQNYGHLICHKIIKLFAKTLQKIIRKEDILSYSGHGRFSLLYPATNALGALTAINRIKSAVKKSPIKLGDSTQVLSFNGAIYACIASEVITAESVQNELEKRLKEALNQEPGSIVTSGHKGSQELVPSVEQALKLLEQNKDEQLSEHSKELMQRIIPLLRYSDMQLNLGMSKVIESLIERLQRR